MTAKEYIKNELEKFVKEFPGVRVRYEYRDRAEAHFIEVIPNRIYHLDEKYILWESEMYDKFTNNFPMQGICFVSDDAFVGIDNAEYVLHGVEYAQITTDKEAMIIEAVIVLQQKTLENWTRITCNDNYCSKDNLIENFTISGDYPNENNQHEYSLAA